MARSQRSVLAFGILLVAAFAGVQVLNFLVAPSAGRPAQSSPSRASVALRARGGGEYDVSDADIANFYAETISGAGGDPPKGTIVAELIVKFFHGEFTPQGFKRYSGLWKGPPPGTIGKKDIAIAMESLKVQMKNPMFVTKGGIGYGIDETMKVADDGKGYTWIAAEMSPGGLAIELFQSVPYGKRALFCAKKGMEDEMFQKINWDLMDKRIDTTLGGPQVIQR
mmetsp:Transcript_4232/g.7200  ORF Transcript_4232/g.7200 Transcript_4232/m.7200 type:complete len:224 (+) Transcript_4232:77-748(+)